MTLSTDLEAAFSEVSAAFSAVGTDVKALNDFKNPLETAVANFNPAFGDNPLFNPTGLHTSSSRSMNASDVSHQPTHGVEVFITADRQHASGERMIPGVGKFVQARLDGDMATANTFFSTIAGYAVVNPTGDCDGIGVHGRARKTSKAGNISDAAGVLGDFYNYSAENGGTMALEGRGYQNVAGMLAGDGYGVNPLKWSTTAHMWSDSTGSPVFAAVLMGGAGTDVGKYSFWNGLSFSKTMFAHNGVGAGIDGTVAINMGDFDASLHPEIALKFGFADGVNSWHIWSEVSPLQVITEAINVENANPAGSSSLILSQAGAAKVSLMWDEPNDQGVLGTEASNPLLLKTNNTERMRIDGNGVVNLLSHLNSLSLTTTGEGITVKRGDGNPFAAIIGNSTDNTILRIASHSIQFSNWDKSQIFGGFTDLGLLYTSGSGKDNGFRVENSNERLDMFFDGDTVDAPFVISYDNSGEYDVILTASSTTANTLNGLWNFAGGEVRVGGAKVVGTQQPAIPNADSGDVDLQADINAILGALRAHGLIAT